MMGEYVKKKKDMNFQSISESEAVELVHEVSALTHAHLRSKMGFGFYYFMIKAILDEVGTLTECLQKGMLCLVIISLILYIHSIILF